MHKGSPLHQSNRCPSTEYNGVDGQEPSHKAAPSKRHCEDPMSEGNKGQMFWTWIRKVSDVVQVLANLKPAFKFCAAASCSIAILVYPNLPLNSGTPNPCEIEIIYPTRPNAPSGPVSTLKAKIWPPDTPLSLFMRRQGAASYVKLPDVLPDHFGEFATRIDLPLESEIYEVVTLGYPDAYFGDGANVHSLPNHGCRALTSVARSKSTKP